MGAMPEWTMLLANVGFPSAVAVYLLLRFEKQIAAQTLAIEDLTRKLETKNEEDN
ncbi:YvrJ family protein [Alkalicoccobacillus plakortidis]|uniref:YvrJ family protein n=1 Tax=Alkalicoccobacillus plakortidis TaxID=444060 RepID=A0ABT0XQ39_9BACI|nr:YvrJ family protein [Alkalicoccobacillus plakortidis]MCM2678018.1 YvrJ family protein [Alkalicoccobacillus plakortidis]